MLNKLYIETHVKKVCIWEFFMSHWIYTPTYNILSILYQILCVNVCAICKMSFIEGQIHKLFEQVFKIILENENHPLTLVLNLCKGDFLNKFHYTELLVLGHQN